MSRIAVLLVMVGAALPLAAQQRPPRVSIAVQAIRSGGWSLRETTGSFVNREASYEAGTSLGLELGVALIPAVVVFASFDTDGGGYGDDSGFSAGEVGAAIRPWALGRLVPFGVASYGRVSESGGVRFGFLSFGAGGDLSLARALAVRAAVKRLAPIGDPSSNRGGPGQTVTVDAGMIRVHLGLVLRF